MTTRTLFTTWTRLTGETLDAAIEPDLPPVMLDGWDSTQTTLRHAREFLKQNGFKADSKKQMQRDYA